MDGCVKFWQMDKNKRKDYKNVTSFLKAAQGVAIHPNVEYIICVGNDPCVKMCAPVTGNKNKNRQFDNWYVKKTL